MTLLLRRVGRGNWSPLRLTYDAARQAELPTPLQAKVGAHVPIGGVTYRVSKVLA